MSSNISDNYAKYFIKFNEIDHKQYEIAASSYETNYGTLLVNHHDAKILDIGCGMGHFLYYLKTRGYKNFSGIDLGETQVDFCKKYFTKDVELANASEYLKYHENEYDVIVMNDVIEHIVKDDVMDLLKLVKKSLKKDGIFLIKTINMSNPFGLNSRYRDFTHEIGYTELSMFQILDAVGFKQISLFQEMYASEGIMRPLANFIRRILYRLLKSLYYLDRGESPTILTPNLIVFAKKP